MKKFLGKLPVMITFVSLAVVMLVVYIGMLVRPVAIGMTYKGEVENFGGKKVETSIKIKNGSEFVMTTEGEDDSIKGRFIVKGREILILPNEMTDKEFKEVKEDALENWKDAKASGMVFKANAFKTELDGEDFICTGSIVFAAVGGVVLVALLTFGTLSVLYYVKGRKK